MNVLSLFDGVSSGLNALQKAKIPVTNYFASEIDKYAESVSHFNHRNIIRLGDVTKLHDILDTLPPIDLLIGGSPCQNLSNAGNGTGLSGEKSSLFFEFIRIRNRLNPKFFMLENVIPKKKEWADEMSCWMGVRPHRINANLVSAQNRDRYYWCNWDVKQPVQHGLVIKDILDEDGIADFPANQTFKLIPRVEKITNSDSGIRFYKKNYTSLSEFPAFLDSSSKSSCVIAERPPNLLLLGMSDHFKGTDQQRRIYDVSGQSPTLVSHGGGRHEVKIGDETILKYRNLTPLECERLQTMPDNYTRFGLFEDGTVKEASKTQRYKMIGNGWCEEVIAHIFKALPCRI